MASKNNVNFITRIILLVIITLLPVYGLIAYSYIQQRDTLIKQAATSQEELVNLLQASQLKLISDTKVVLESLGDIPVIRNNQNSAACSQTLADILKRHPEYTNLGVINSEGLITCSAVPQNTNINVSDRSYFLDAVRSKKFSIGKYQIGRVTGRASLNFGLPVLAPNNEIQSVIYAALDINWLNNLLNDTNIPAGSTISTIDSQGVLLVRYPQPEQWVGKDVENSEIAHYVLNTKTAGAIETKGVDGIVRIYNYAPLGDRSNPSGYIWAGTDKSILLKPGNELVKQNLLILAIVTLIAILVAWFIGSTLIVNRIRALQEIDQAKDEFISIASHQLRTPLTAIRLYSELLSEHPKIKEDKDLSENTSIIHESTLRMIKLVGDILNVSRLQLGSLKVDPKPTQMEDILTGITQELFSTAKARGVALKTILPKTKLPIINIDESLIHQVIHNLVTNAIRYTNPGSGIIEISASPQQNNSGILISVKDNGIGIPTAEQKNIFSRFFRAANAIKHNGEGTGLGMYLAKMIVDIADGKIWFESKEGQGTTFYITLPENGMIRTSGTKSLN